MEKYVLSWNVVILAYKLIGLKKLRELVERDRLASLVHLLDWTCQQLLWGQQKTSPGPVSSGILCPAAVGPWSWFMSLPRCCHSGPHPTSLTGWWLSDRLQVLGNLPLDDPTPCSYPLPSSPARAARSAVAPANRPQFLAHWLTHPLVPRVTDGVGGTVRQGQKYGLTLITPALLPAITFTAPSSTTTPRSICHQH